MGKKIFKITSAILIAGCFIFFGYRAVHYYRIYNGGATKGGVSTTSKMELYKKVINNSYINNDLIKTQSVYYYGKNFKNNYVKYSGLLWQIISINKNNEIKMVSKDNIVYLANHNKYDDSYIKEYLNDTEGSLYKNLDSPESYLVDTEVCLDGVDNINEILCEEKKNYTIGTLSLNDYASTGAMNGFLNNSTNFWLATMNDKLYYYISDTNEVETTSLTYTYGVRPVITLNKNIMYTDGEGSIDKPYLIGEKKADVLNQKNINEYVLFNNQTWKIISQDEVGTKVALNGILENKMKFDTKVNDYDKSSLYQYLNTDYYNSISDKEKIVMGKWYIGNYNATNSYDYKKIYEKEIEAYVGLPSIMDFFLSDYTDIYTLTPAIESVQTIYIISNNNGIIANSINAERNIKPVVYLNSNTIIKSGSGSEKDPYVME